ncbi:unnamed protein product [Closterium sp. NIES-53]
MGDIEDPNYWAGNVLTRRVQGPGEELGRVTLESPFAQALTEAELANSQRALYEQALNCHDSVASAAKKKCIHLLPGVPAPKKGGHSRKSAGKKGKNQGKKCGGARPQADDLPATKTNQESLEPESHGAQPTSASFLQQLHTNSHPTPPPPASSEQQQNLHFLADATTASLLPLPQLPHTLPPPPHSGMCSSGRERRRSGSSSLTPTTPIPSPPLLHPQQGDGGEGGGGAGAGAADPFLPPP